MDDNIRAALIGFHTFTGNNYVLSIFMRVKQACFKVMKQRDEATNAFRLLGRLGVERRAHSCIGKFCMSFIQIQRYRYQQSLKEIIWQKVSVWNKKSWIYHCCLLDSPHYICTSCSRVMSQGLENVIYSMWSTARA